jgi:DNA-binding IclR family transcriptional regulator
MSKTLLRGLELIEAVGQYGPLTVSELARRTGVDVTIVSRTVSACAAEGWLTKDGGKITTGGRCALVGLTSPVSQAIRQAEPLLGAVAGVTGTVASANGLVGDEVMVLAAAGDAGTGAELPDGLPTRVPIHLLAAGRAIAAGLPDARLRAALPPEPFPDARESLAALASSEPIPAYLENFQGDDGRGASLPLTMAALAKELDAIRAGGFARDDGIVHPAIHCIAVPWPLAAVPAALACFGTRAAIEERRELIEECLRTAVRPGALAADVIAAGAPG